MNIMYLMLQMKIIRYKKQVDMTTTNYSTYIDIHGKETYSFSQESNKQQKEEYLFQKICTYLKTNKRTLFNCTFLDDFLWLWRILNI